MSVSSPSDVAAPVATPQIDSAAASVTGPGATAATSDIAAMTPSPARTSSGRPSRSASRNHTGSRTSCTTPGTRNSTIAVAACDNPSDRSMSGAPPDGTPEDSSSMNGIPNSSAVIDGRRRVSRPSDAPATMTLARTADQMRSVKRFAIARDCSRTRAPRQGTSPGLAGPPQRPARLRPRMLAILEHLRAVDKDVLDADRVLVRLLEGGAVTDRLGIEDHHVGEHAALQQAAMVQPQVRRGQARQSTDGFADRDDLLVAHVPAEQPSKIAVEARVRRALGKDAFRRHGGSIRAEGHPGLTDLLLDVLFTHEEVDGSNARAILEHQIHDRLDGVFASHPGDLGERLSAERLQLLRLEAEEQRSE